MSDESLFDFVRELAGGHLTQAQVDKLNQILTEAQVPIVVTGSTVPHFHTIAAHLEREEGRVDHVYKDSEGWWTIGVGRLVDSRKGGHLSNEEIDMLLTNDIQSHMRDIETWPAWQAVKDDPVRATALLSMAFQMGADNLAEFKNSLRLIADKQWAAAADALMKSLWARQTTGRAQRVTQMIATGVMQR
jgi:lysozyme